MTVPPRPDRKQWPQVPCTCGAAVIWATTDKGGRMPVDPEPLATGGNVDLRDIGRDEPLAVVLSVSKQFGRYWLHTSHFATCPHAARHRRRGRS